MSTEPQGTERHLVDYWYLLVRRRTLVLGFAAAVTAAVLVYSLLSPKTYRAGALLKIDPKAPVILDNVGVTQEGVGSQWGQQVRAYYATQYRIMESRPVLQEAIRRLREEHGIGDFDDVANPVGMLRSMMTVAPEPETQLVRLRITYTDPEKAALFANTVAQAYIDDKLARSLEDSQKAMGFLAEQLEVYRSRRVSSSEEVHRFQYEHAFPSSDADSHVTIGTLRRLQEQWSEARARRVAAQAAYEGLVKVSRERGLMPVATHLAAEDPVLRDLLQRVEELEHERAGLAVRVREGHPDMARVDALLESLRSQLADQVQRNIDARRAELELLQVDEDTLAAELEAVQAAVRDLGDTFVELELLKSEADRNAQFFRELDIRVTEVALSQFLQASNVKFVERAVPSLVPISPKPVRNTLAALLVGLLGGSALAFLFEYFDLNVKSREDVEQLLGVPFLGMVPRVPKETLAELEGPLSESVFVMERPRSLVAEALRTIRTTVFFGVGRQTGIRLLVTSSIPQEGKSFVTANLAAIIAMGNARTVVIDGDMRRSTLHALYNLPNLRGLSDLLQGEARIDDVIQKTPLPNLDLIAAGRHFDKAGELLDLEKLEALLSDLQKRYDIVIVDSPPLRPVADAAVFASLVDAAVFVVESARTRRQVAAEAVRALKQVNPPVLGAVVNKVDTESSAGGYYYYYHKYGGYGTYYGRDGDEPSEDQAAG